VFADVSSGKHAIGSRPDHPESGLAHDPDVLARLGLYVARIGKFEYGLFRVADQPGAVEGDMVCSGTEQAKVERLQTLLSFVVLGRPISFLQSAKCPWF
jgi:hypothetical protein